MSKILQILALIGLIVNSTIAQNINVKGKVTDANGSSLPGVSIIIKNATHGTVTDKGCTLKNYSKW